VAFAPREYGAGTFYKDFTDEYVPERKAETEQDIQKLWEKE
jgi:hypothetical protein